MGILKKERQKQEQLRKQYAELQKGAAPIPEIPEVKRYTKSEIVVERPAVETAPMGYTALGSDQKDLLLKIRDHIINEAKIFSYDYETNAWVKEAAKKKEKRETVGFEDEDEADELVQDPQDSEVVGVSFSYQIGQAFYLPIKHVLYDKNWEKEWLRENFLKPILLHPDVVIIAHNIQNEHKYNILDFGIDIREKAKKRKVHDTMYLVKCVAPNECMEYMGEDGYDLRVGLKPATKALLADKNGVVHGLLHVDEIKEFKEMVAIDVPVGVYKQGKNKGKPKYEKRYTTFDQLPVEKDVIDYACSDSDWALGLYRVLYPKLKEEGLEDVYFEMDIRAALVFGQYELTGLHASRERLEELRKKAEDALYREGGIEETLHRMLLKAVEGVAPVDGEGNVIIPAGAYPMGVWRDQEATWYNKSDKVFNWSSREHVRWLFFYALKFPTDGMERSKRTGYPKTSKLNIKKLEYWCKDHPHYDLLKVYKDYVKYHKILSTYVEGMGKHIREDTSKIHTSFGRVATWRMNSNAPNMQNIPRSDNDPMGIRKIFVAPSYDLSKDYSHLNPFTRPNPVIFEKKLSGHTMWISCDYSQIELKVLAWYAMEESMLEAFRQGIDLHSKTARDVYKLDCDVFEVKKKYNSYRKRAKAVNFGVVYGLTEYGLSKDPEMDMTTKQAKEFIDQYLNTYKGVKGYADAQVKFAEKHGYVQTAFGHRRNIPEINSPNKWERQRAVNKAMNTPIQGTAADIMIMSMVRFDDEIPKRAPYLKPILPIHDDLIFECPVEYVVEGAKFIKEIMETPVPGFNDDPNAPHYVPVTAEPAVGKTWAHSLDIKWDENGKAYVVAKSKRKDPADVTIDDIKDELKYFEMAGIEVRVD